MSDHHLQNDMKIHEYQNNNMEPFYEENEQYGPIATQSCIANNLKRPASLNLNLTTNNNKQTGKKQRNQSVLPQAMLDSPDLNMLKWGTPDLEKFIISSEPLQTPTPSLIANPIKGVTNEQEEYAQPFVDALNDLRQSDKAKRHLQSHQNNVIEFTIAGTTSAIINPVTTMSSTSSTMLSKVGMSGGSVIYTNLEDGYPAVIKDEPQTVPNSPPMSPINMKTQEKAKLERKRQRNRVAASKCRKRKLERISKLEDKVKQLKCENVELGGVIKQLKEHVILLKSKVIEHINNGCSIPTYTTAYFVRPPKTIGSDIK